MNILKVFFKIVALTVLLTTISCNKCYQCSVHGPSFGTKTTDTCSESEKEDLEDDGYHCTAT